MEGKAIKHVKQGVPAPADVTACHRLHPLQVAWRRPTFRGAVDKVNAPLGGRTESQDALQRPFSLDWGAASGMFR